MSQFPRTIFVSGGTRGIGRAIVSRFHCAGWRVGTCSRSQADLDELLRSLPGVKTWCADLSKRPETTAMASEVADSLGPLDVLVNNAGAFEQDDLTSSDLTTFDHLMELNLASAVVLSHRLVPAMRTERRGTVVHICSVAGIKGYPSGMSYCISKHAMLGLARAMREELRPDGVRVVSVLPGATWTTTWDNSGQTEDRMMPPEDIAEVVWMACAVSSRTVIEDIILRPQLGDI